MHDVGAESTKVLLGELSFIINYDFATDLITISKRYAITDDVQQASFAGSRGSHNECSLARHC